MRWISRPSNVLGCIFYCVCGSFKANEFCLVVKKIWWQHICCLNIILAVASQRLPISVFCSFAQFLAIFIFWAYFITTVLCFCFVLFYFNITTPYLRWGSVLLFVPRNLLDTAWPITIFSYFCPATMRAKYLYIYLRVSKRYVFVVAFFPIIHFAPFNADSDELKKRIDNPSRIVLLAPGQPYTLLPLANIKK